MSQLIAKAVLCLLVIAPAWAQDEWQDYRSAQLVITRAVGAHGGQSALQGIQTLVFDYAGDYVARNQSRRPEGPSDLGTRRMFGYMDLSRKWIGFNGLVVYPGGIPEAQYRFFRGNEGITFDAFQKTWFPMAAPASPQQLDFVNRMVPALLLRQLMQQRKSASFEGQKTVAGRLCDLLFFTWPNGNNYTLYFDAQTHLLHMVESLVWDNMNGESLGALIFEDYTQLQGLAVNRRMRQTVDGEAAMDLRLADFQVNQSVDHLFQIPDGYVQVAPDPMGLNVTTLAPDVYLAGNGVNHMLFVAFADFFLVVESPTSGGFTAAALKAVRQEAGTPDKPVKYLVLTHHHEDHVAGLTTFVRQGAQVVTSRDNLAYLERINGGQRFMTGGFQPPKGPAPQFQWVEGRWETGDEARKVVIYDIGPSPHAEHMLIAYLPQEKILFQADVLILPHHGPVCRTNPSTVHFSRTIEKLGLEVAQIAGVHGRVGSREDLDRVLANAPEPAPEAKSKSAP